MIQPGYVWKGEYYVWPLDGILNVSLKKDATVDEFLINTPHRVKMIKLLPDEDWKFPLKERYEKATLNGDANFLNLQAGEEIDVAETITSSRPDQTLEIPQELRRLMPARLLG